MTKDERSLLVFLETQAVDHGGKVFSASMNADDIAITKSWIESGFIQFGRIKANVITHSRFHWVILSDEAWRKAGELRKERALRNLPPSEIKTRE